MEAGRPRVSLLNISSLQAPGPKILQHQLFYCQKYKFSFFDSLTWREFWNLPKISRKYSLLVIVMYGKEKEGVQNIVGSHIFLFSIDNQMNQFPNLIQRSLNLNREPNLSGSIIELKAIFRQEVYQAVIHHKALKPDDVGRYWLRQQFHNKILPLPPKKHGHWPLARYFRQWIRSRKVLDSLPSQ